MKTLLLYSENGCKLAQNFINNILRSGLNESRFPCSDVHRAKLITNNDTGRLRPVPMRGTTRPYFRLKPAPLLIAETITRLERAFTG